MKKINSMQENINNSRKDKGLDLDENDQRKNKDKGQER